MYSFGRTSDRILPRTRQSREMFTKRCALVEAVQRFDEAQGSYIMQSR